MGLELTRSFVIGRALAADKWLTAYEGTTLLKADAAALGRYLDTLMPHSREDVQLALMAWGDDAIRRGIVSVNAARELRFEIDLRDEEPQKPARTKAARAR